MVDSIFFVVVCFFEFLLIEFSFLEISLDEKLCRYKSLKIINYSYSNCNFSLVQSEFDLKCQKLGVFVLIREVLLLTRKLHARSYPNITTHI